MRAVVLVGGEGTRLRPLTYTTPKPLLPIANQPFLERQLDWLAAHGVDDVVLSLGYLPRAFETHFEGGRYRSMSIRYAVEPEPRGTAGGVRFAAEGFTERFVVCNGDVLTSLDLGKLVAFHERCGAVATISLTRVENPSAFGVVPTDASGEVQAFVEKPEPGTAPTDWINAGTYVLEPSVLDAIAPDRSVSIERETFPSLLEERGRVYAMRSEGYWLDIGTPAKFLEAHADALAGRLGRPPVAGAVARAGVWLQGTDAVPAGVRAPALVGPGARVAPDARVEASVLGPGVVVESGAVVERSVLFEGAVVGPRARVADSIVGWRAQLGVGVTVTDATMIGADAVVEPGVVCAGGRIDGQSRV